MKRIKRLLAAVAIAAAAFAMVPAHAVVGGACTDPVSVNCTYGPNNDQNCTLWANGGCVA